MILWLWWQPGVRWQLWHEHGASINIPSSNIFMAQFWLDQCLVFTSPKARQKVRHYVLHTPLTAAPASACCRDCLSCQTVQSPSISMKRQLLCKNIRFCDKTWIRGLQEPHCHWAEGWRGRCWGSLLLQDWVLLSCWIHSDQESYSPSSINKSENKFMINLTSISSHRFESWSSSRHWSCPPPAPEINGPGWGQDKGWGAPALTSLWLWILCVYQLSDGASVIELSGASPC